MTENNSSVTGDSNIVIQGVNARDIIIYQTPDLPVEVKQQKEVLSVKLKELVETLALIEKQSAAIPKPGTDSTAENNPAYAPNRRERLLQAISYQGCVLFIGPEISVNSEGKSLHHEFYNSLANKYYGEIEYMENEGYFSPESEDTIIYDVLRFYSKEFPAKNVAGRKILEQFAQVPFSLIISICPDDTMHSVFDDYDLNHKFIAYDGTKQEVEPMTPEKPVIYNILGNAAIEGGKYVFTHENFYQYLNNIFIPSEIKKKIQDATHFLFIGFDFNKWYNRLLLFILGLKQKKSSDRATIGTKNVIEDVENFIAKQFNITFVDNDHKQFIEWLLYNVNKNGKLRNLNQDFVQRSFDKIKTLTARTNSNNSIEELFKIEGQVGEVAKSINRLKQIISG